MSMMIEKSRIYPASELKPGWQIEILTRGVLTIKEIMQYHNVVGVIFEDDHHICYMRDAEVEVILEDHEF